jgi:plastocyanin
MHPSREVNMKKTLFIGLLVIAVLISGCTTTTTTQPAPQQTPETTTPTPTPIPAIMTPAPTPELTPFVAATPTGKNVTIIVKDDKYSPADITIDAGDMVLWVNKMDSDYTLVEMDKKIPDMVLRARNSYIFNTTGNYRIGLYFKPMRGDPAILTLNVK